MVQQYYNEINQSDYQDAYQIWGREWQQYQQSYAQFASGYAMTRNVDLTFDGTIQLGDGVFKVTLTFTATDGTRSGQVTSTFSGDYIIGQENGKWKLLTANIQKAGWAASLIIHLDTFYPGMVYYNHIKKCLPVFSLRN